MFARIFIVAMVAGFLAIMAAGPGIMIPGHFELWAPVVCGQVGDGFEPEVQTGVYTDAYGRQGGTSYNFKCKDSDGRTEDVTGRLVGTAFGAYFIVLFIVFLLIAVLKRKPKPPAQQAPS